MRIKSRVSFNNCKILTRGWGGGVERQERSTSRCHYLLSTRLLDIYLLIFLRSLHTSPPAELVIRLRSLPGQWPSNGSLPCWPGGQPLQRQGGTASESQPPRDALAADELRGFDSHNPRLSCGWSVLCWARLNYTQQNVMGLLRHRVCTVYF